MEAFFVAISSLVGVAIGGYITYLTNKQAHQREDARQRKQDALVRFEEMHKALIMLDEHHRSSFAVMIKRFAGNQPVDVGELVKNPIADTTFLVEAFLPEASVKLQEVVDIQRQIGELLGEALSRKIEQGQQSSLVTRCFELEKKWEKALQSIRNDLHKAARQTHDK